MFGALSSFRGVTTVLRTLVQSWAFLFCFVLFFKQARIYAEKRGSSMKGSHL